MLNNHCEWANRVKEIVGLAQSTSPLIGAVVLGALSVGSALSAPTGAADQMPSYLAIVALAWVRSFLWFVALGTLIRWLIKHLPRIGALLHGLLYSSTEALRAVLIGAAGVENAFIGSIDLEYRIIAGGFTGVTLLGLGAVLLNDSREFRRHRTQLEAVRFQILETSKSLKLELEQKRISTVTEIRILIEAAMRAALGQASGGNPAGIENAVNELVRLSNEAIRPLSHALRQHPPALMEYSNAVENVRIDFRQLLDRSTIANPIRPWILGSLAFMLIIGAALTSENPMLNLLTTVGAIGWMLGVAEFLRRTVLGWLRGQRNLGVRIAALTGLFLLVTANPLVGGFAFEQVDRGSGISLVVYAILLSLALQWVIAVYAGLNSFRQDTLDQLEKQNEKLRWLKARSVAKLWANQQNLAHSIHKDVQGHLIAEAMRLQQNLSAGMHVREALERTQTELLLVMERVGKPQPPVALERQIEDLNQTWCGVFSLELIADAELMSNLATDRETNQILNDFVAEFVLNSVKHGEALNGQLTLEQTHPDVIRLSVWNDGKPFESQVAQGMGLELFSRQTMNFWHSGPGVKGALITAELAFAPSGADKL